MIGTAVPASSEDRKREEDAAGDQRSDLRRQELGSTFRGSSRASREEAPEESIFLKRDAAPEGLRTGGERSETRERSTQEGPRNTGRFWPMRPRFHEDGPEERKASEPSGGAVE